MSAGAGRPGVPRPSGASRYGWFVGVVIVLALALITLNTALSRHQSSTGPPAGRPMPAFAAPLATGRLEGDVDVAVRPDQGSAGKVPACRLRGAGILNSCQLVQRGPVALAFFDTRGGDCVTELDRLAAASEGVLGLQAAAVAIRGDRGSVRPIVRAHRWGFPVAYDRDGTLANLYGVAVCPQITLAYPGGRVRKTLIGGLSTAALHRQLMALWIASMRRGWRVPDGG